eukprot:CAMPEP_0177642456 /NCGR_PEP_ID=MMETSP0447-20121125/7596_1 /TAXON_ID=0 /ORGANISM="Stygamoeba regulata, Strain BSH-02190019" /LENGTH=66 /DNA_ID=CAMNT_0019144615 /DNA_START=143 /DNA_END=343 /DNA_ORIENTATION=-
MMGAVNSAMTYFFVAWQLERPYVAPPPRRDWKAEALKWLDITPIALVRTQIEATDPSDIVPAVCRP